MRSKPRLLLALAWLVLAGCQLAGCQQAAQPPLPVDPPTTASAAGGESGGAISSPAVVAQPMAADILKGTKWPPAKLASGTASISCDTDYAEAGDGQPLVDLGFFSVLDAMTPCREAGVVRLRYEGKISSDFADLVERVTAMAERMDIDKRILDIDSAGGQVEDGIRAGDTIGDSHWTIWVRSGDVCHSACVFILAAGDNRLVSGPVGIHRIIRLHSDATTRAELDQELRAVHDRIKDYFARNGADVAVADMMMTVPSSALRLLTADELREYGLSGSNPVQDDLERIRLARKCGEPFVHRREAFLRAFEQKCAGADAATDGTTQDVEGMSDCGVQLRKRYGFPDRKCPAESPLSEYD
jgi:ATP-dependent protease ClpP protease subunit